MRSAEHGPSEGRSPATDGALVKKLAQTCRRCAEEDGADTVILGCLSFAGLGAQVSALAGLPVIDPAFTLVGTAELLVRQGLCHSKLAYPLPPRAVRAWSGGTID